MTTKNKNVITTEPGKQDLLITREFDAPRELVYRAFTEADLYAQWVGPRNYRMRLETFDARSGGSYRYIHADPGGSEFAFHGVFHLVSPELIIQTFEYEGMREPGHVSLESARFEELPGGRTRVVMHSVFPSVEDRDGMINAGMEVGVNEGHERLDEVLARLQRKG